MKSLLIAAFAALIALVPANASQFRVDMVGQLYAVTPSVSNEFQVGDSVVASFTFDASDPGENWYPGGNLDPAFRYFPNAPLGGGLSVNGYRVTFNSGARMFVSNNELASYGPIDRVIFDDYSADAGPVAGMNFRGVFFNFQDWTATATDDLRLPNSQEAFDRFGLPSGAIDWLTNDAEHRITFAMDSVTVTALPEPGTWAMLILGFGFLGCSLRLQKRNARIARKCVSVTA